ncbi:hypothetical protein BCR34DRAFT_561339 [Clohesyomyces aquaticus]|uniref:Uncharacterized protein n=1 Tax=Clohesyomyces aquaticus TaxID=1231657 RepID=A0A1Y1ZUS7_9PLEO|nr:hypothetical protein BCR34DRAFT_561339 [Clohesyomyces aquaticus]
MRQALCNEIGDCADNWSHPWDSVWRCNAEFQASPVKVCGGGGSCKPNNVGC